MSMDGEYGCRFERVGWSHRERMLPPAECSIDELDAISRSIRLSSVGKCCLD